jgi:tetratricopeptide (TPR) repeat protein
MKRKSDLPAENQSSSRHFLYSKSDPRPAGRPRPDPHPNVESGLKTAFPNLMTEADLIGAVDRQFSAAPELFCMALRPDIEALETAVQEPAALPEIYRRTAEIVSRMCRDDRSLWGMVGPDVLAAAMPSGDRDPRATAETLKGEVQRETGCPLTVGIAVYPTLDYTVGEILQCACKALAHAAFFGPGSHAVFDAVSLNISGDRFYDRGDLAGAIKEFERALVLDAKNVNVHNSLGVCHALLKDYDAALEFFRKALQIEPAEYMARYNVGLIHLLRGNRPSALAHFLKAHDCRADVYEVLLQIGKLYLETGEPGLGIGYLEKASALNPGGGLSFRYLAEAHAAEGRIEQAASTYKKAVQANPNDAVSLSALGCLYDQQGENLEISIVFCEESVRLAPDNGLFRFRLGKLYAKQNRTQEALKELEKARFLGYEPAAKEIRNLQRGLSAEAN